MPNEKQFFLPLNEFNEENVQIVKDGSIYLKKNKIESFTLFQYKKKEREHMEIIEKYLDCFKVFEKEN